MYLGKIRGIPVDSEGRCETGAEAALVERHAARLAVQNLGEIAQLVLPGCGASSVSSTPWQQLCVRKRISSAIAPQSGA